MSPTWGAFLGALIGGVASTLVLHFLDVWTDKQEQD